MSDSQKKSIPFKVSSRMIRMFGRQNVSNPLVAIIELIKNAYDADAHMVTVVFSNASTSSGTIIISDDGSGMDEDAFSNRWMMIGTDYKEREPVSQGGRIRTGAKGIGRFALDRLGDTGILETWQSSEEGLRLLIDWTKYNDLAKSFESITHELASVPNPSGKPGTKITITNLRDHWTKDDYGSLYDDLVFLIPPLNSYTMDFSVNLQIDEYPELSGLVEPLAREEAEYELTSTINADGLVHHVLKHRSGEETTKEILWSQINPQLKLFEVGPACGPVEAKILFYLINNPNIVKSFDYKQADLQRYLRVFRGVRIYRDGFQIKPYGSKGNDWLELDARKNASGMGGVSGDLGSYHVNNRQIIGTVMVSRQTNPNLEDRTSREGLIENEAYSDLKKFLINAISFLEIERQYSIQRSRNTTTDGSLEETIENIVATVERIQTAPMLSENVVAITPTEEALQPADIQPSTTIPIEQNDILRFTEPQTTLIDAVTNIIVAPHQGKKRVVDEIDVSNLVSNIHELESQIQEIQVLRSLATIGIALATFSHEIKNKILLLSSEIKFLEELIILIPQNDKAEEAQNSLEIALSSVRNIKNWSDFVLERIKKGRRTEQVINFSQLVNLLFQSFKSSLEHYSITSSIQIEDNIPLFKAFPIDYEAILINFISNATKALEGRSSRHIQCCARYYQAQLQLEITFEDNGPGIDIRNLPHPHGSIQQIFEPFISASQNNDKTNDGTGMGLAIVRRIVNDLRGTVRVQGQGELGGAKFIVRVPIKKVEN